MNELHKHFMAKALRKNFTNAERLLWRHLRAKQPKQMEGYKFRRQEPIGSYIVDFCVPRKKDSHRGRGGLAFGGTRKRFRKRQLAWWTGI